MNGALRAIVPDWDYSWQVFSFVLYVILRRKRTATAGILEGAEVAPKQLKVAIFRAVFLTNFSRLTSRSTTDITYGPAAERST